MAPNCPASPLKVFAYCTPDQRWAVARAAGVAPITCPPMTMDLFPPGALRHRDFLYLSLHGRAEQPFWYGEDHITAMSVEAFKGLDLSATVVFVANCHLPKSPFLAAILACDPLLLVAGRGTNLTRGNSLVGAHHLGYLFRLAISLCISPPDALALAKYTLTLRTDALEEEKTRLKTRLAHKRLNQDIAANKDALEFQAYA